MCVGGTGVRVVGRLEGSWKKLKIEKKKKKKKQKKARYEI